MLATVLATVLATTETLSEVRLDAMLVVVLVSFVIPALTGALTKITAPAWVKQVVTLVLAAANGLITSSAMDDGSAVITKEAALMALLSLAIALTSYLGIYRPNDANGHLLADKGLG